MTYLIGIDEAGRGPLAGPLTVGFAIADESVDLLTLFPGLNDSKQLTEKKREALYQLLEEKVLEGIVRFHVEWINAKTIDEEGLTKPIRDAIARGLKILVPSSEGNYVYLDGSLAAPAEYAQKTVPGGDALIPTIMLASVAAKVERDRHMKVLAETYPAYGFEKHKGYGTKAHYAAIHASGPCSEHRQLFLRKLTL